VDIGVSVYQVIQTLPILSDIYSPQLLKLMLTIIQAPIKIF